MSQSTFKLFAIVGSLVTDLAVPGLLYHWVQLEQTAAEHTAGLDISAQLTGLLAATAQPTDDPFAAIGQAGIAGALDLTFDASCPSGGYARLSWSNATPGGEVVLIYARETGSFRIARGGPCGGVSLGLGEHLIQVVFHGGAGETGSRTINTYTGPGACGGYLQLLDLTTCQTSNVELIE
ncbi:MAG: hypothetical protein IT430_07665 [Phycisphaerales bacterium]|nr:hypothetical protein [Phycisphaerales bacterium]